ncbi:MAG: aminotransferase class V-fold PLP-dependent enzyme [Candidatus Eremiobacteraeota bacterium]|nr:aminotransferase class V-fold PLP-dependent enzyme [Candidatus Eremiobacteraeota bacterium]
MSMPRSGQHFVQIPGPTNIPERVLRAMDRQIIDHRGPEFAALTLEILPGMRELVKTKHGHVVIYPSSGTGAWEAAVSNVLSPGERVLVAETGQFSAQWAELTSRLGIHVDVIPGDWRTGADPEEIARRLSADPKHDIRAVMVVHNETSTGVLSRIAEIRAAIDRAGHPALFLVDTVSSLASVDYRHDEWGVDVMVCGSQKGLMLPPGLGINVVSQKALDASKRSRFPRSYFDWAPIIGANADGFFPYTPPTLLMFGLRESLAVLREEGHAAVFARHARLAEATRQAVHGWGLEILARDPREYSNTLTAVVVPDGVDADRVRRTILDRFDISLGVGLGKVKGRVFRIGHLGSLNDVMLAGVLCGVEMGLRATGIPVGEGVAAALRYLVAPESLPLARTPALA